MGTTSSTPAGTAVDRKGTSKPARKSGGGPTASGKHGGGSSPAFLKKGPRNYVDMGIEEESQEQLEQGSV